MVKLLKTRRYWGVLGKDERQNLSASGKEIAEGAVLRNYLGRCDLGWISGERDRALDVVWPVSATGSFTIAALGSLFAR
jgi:hypothetical protein